MVEQGGLHFRVGLLRSPLLALLGTLPMLDLLVRLLRLHTPRKCESKQKCSLQCPCAPSASLLREGGCKLTGPRWVRFLMSEVPLYMWRTPQAKSANSELLVTLATYESTRVTHGSKRRSRCLISSSVSCACRKVTPLSKWTES